MQLDTLRRSCPCLTAALWRWSSGGIGSSNGEIRRTTSRLRPTRGECRKWIGRLLRGGSACQSSVVVVVVREGYGRFSDRQYGSVVRDGMVRACLRAALCHQSRIPLCPIKHNRADNTPIGGRQDKIDGTTGRLKQACVVLIFDGVRVLAWLSTRMPPKPASESSLPRPMQPRQDYAAGGKQARRRRCNSAFPTTNRPVDIAIAIHKVIIYYLPRPMTSCLLLSVCLSAYMHIMCGVTMDADTRKVEINQLHSLRNITVRICEDNPRMTKRMRLAWIACQWKFRACVTRSVYAFSCYARGPFHALVTPQQH